MNLQNIKLAGFKSFVDPTAVHFPGKLVAVVGPNGSGKSNIIDAVRWVMGESSAKNLRGELMSDVIFNGSSGRAPLAQASIELIFDNTSGKMGGQYASYQQISVKRKVTRDEQSHYYLNGARCRRRDIADLFLGTGVGPRSYAIIMQDTISRIIEAKPDELRVYLEETAGISKYKERRRETSLRIKHTRENLDRLNDLREEIDKQLSHLKRQSRAAERYKVLKEEERLTRARLQVLQWKQFDLSLQQHQKEIRQEETALEEIIAKQSNIDSECERYRELQIEATERVNEAQGQYYKIGSELGRLEQEKRHQQDRKEQLTEDVKQSSEHLEHAKRQHREDESLIDELNKQESTLKLELEQANIVAKDAKHALELSEGELQQWQSKWDEFNQRSAKSLQQAQVGQTGIQHLEQRQLEIKTRLEQSLDEKSHVDLTVLNSTIKEFESKVADKKETQEQLKRTVERLQLDIKTTKQEKQSLTSALEEEKTKLHKLQSRYSSLEALQNVALGQKDENVVGWLRDNELFDSSRLAEDLKVEAGWEEAVETALAGYLEAVCVDDVTSSVNALSSLKDGSVTLLDSKDSEMAAANINADVLINKVKTRSSAVNAILANVFIASNSSEANDIVKGLDAHQSVITKNGVWIGKGWARVSNYSEGSGVLVRKHEITELKDHIEKVEQTAFELQQKLASTQDSVNELEQKYSCVQDELQQATAALSERQARLHVRQAEFNQSKHRLQSLDETISKLQEEKAKVEQELMASRQLWQQALTEIEENTQKRDQLSKQRERLQGDVKTARHKSHEDSETAHELALRYESVVVQLASHKSSLLRAETQLVQLNERKDHLQDLLAKAEEPINTLQTKLDAVLERQLEAERNLKNVRQGLDEIDNKLRGFSQSRNEIESRAQKKRGMLEAKRLEQKTVQVRCNSIEEQLLETQLNVQEILKEIPDDVDASSEDDKLQSIVRRVERLGPINLAAIDEYKEVSERKVYLDSQNNDLEEALNTLENAIRKIDRETRQRFKETFDEVNGHFQQLFPKVFGGGGAYLELTGDDLLETGVAVMAQPPGKKNSTIHLLSGGEKALSALALVFSLFQLNPAPFCMLDEVDASLDDDNVLRFCRLVKEMSKEVQFIFISHNKLTIEIADHLIGVTMREPGVSRLVAVDVEEAVSMAEA